MAQKSFKVCNEINSPIFSTFGLVQPLSDELNKSWSEFWTKNESFQKIEKHRKEFYF